MRYNLKTVQELIEQRAWEEAKMRADNETYRAIGSFGAINLEVSKSTLESALLRMDLTQLYPKTTLNFGRSEILQAINEQLQTKYRVEAIERISKGVLEAFDQIQGLISTVEDLQNQNRS